MDYPRAPPAIQPAMRRTTNHRSHARQRNVLTVLFKFFFCLTVSQHVAMDYPRAPPAVQPAMRRTTDHRSHTCQCSMLTVFFKLLLHIAVSEHMAMGNPRAPPAIQPTVRRTTHHLSHTCHRSVLAVFFEHCRCILVTVPFIKKLPSMKSFPQCTLPEPRGGRPEPRKAIKLLCFCEPFRTSVGLAHPPPSCESAPPPLGLPSSRGPEDHQFCSRPLAPVVRGNVCNGPIGAEHGLFCSHTAARGPHRGRRAPVVK